MDPRIVGRYALYTEIASGGMATVHIGRLLGPVGFSRTVAIKRLHPQFAKDPEFVSMFLDEARLAARIRHPNVVSTLDVVALDGELFLVMEYVQGESLSKLIRGVVSRKERIPQPIVLSIISGMLSGLHAAHEAKSERGEPLGIVHRDISPHNVLVGVDGTARVLDFGIAKAVGRLQATREGQFKGKLSYIAPEQLRSELVGRRADIYSSCVVLWEALTGRKCFHADTEWALYTKIVEGRVEPPSKHNPQVPPYLDSIVLRGLSLDPEKRFASAREMAVELEKAGPLASLREVGDWVEQTAADTLQRRAGQVAEVETGSAAITEYMMSQTGETDPVGQLLRTAISEHDTLRAGRESVASAPRSGTGSGMTSPSAIFSQPTTTSLPPQESSIPSSKPNGESSRASRRLPLVLGGLAFALTLVTAGLFVLKKSPNLSAKSAVLANGSAESTASVAPSQAPAIELPAASVGDVQPVAPTTGAVPDKAMGKPIFAGDSKSGHGTSKGKGAEKSGQPDKSSAPDKTAATPPPPPPPPSDDCNPPYTIDAQGIRRPKPKCL
jgi:serine/threonine-protein kinase